MVAVKVVHLYLAHRVCAGRGFEPVHCFVSAGDEVHGDDALQRARLCRLIFHLLFLHAHRKKHHHPAHGVANVSLLVTFRVPKRRLHYHSFEHFPSAFSARAQEKALSGALLAQASPLCGSGMQLLLPKLLSKLSPRLSKLLVRALLAAIQTRLRSCCISSASLASSSASLACSSASLACCMRVSSSNLACCIRICCARSFFLVHSSIFLS